MWKQEQSVRFEECPGTLPTFQIYSTIFWPGGSGLKTEIVGAFRGFVQGSPVCMAVSKDSGVEVPVRWTRPAVNFSESSIAVREIDF